MAVLDVSIVNVALRSIPHALGFNRTALQGVVNAHRRLRADVSPGFCCSPVNGPRGPLNN
jgi:hypothetical protein